MTRIWAGLFACASLVIAAPAAAQGHPDKGGPAAHPGGGPGGHVKHQHHHQNGHMLLGAKLKQDGRHAMGKFNNHDVVAEVKGGKVVAMSAGDMPAKRVRSKTKMAWEDGGLVPAAWGGALQLAQYDAYASYGYCLDDGVNFDCYWYPPEDVPPDYTWEDYDPTW